MLDYPDFDIKTTTAPGTEPVTLAQARLHLRIDADMTDDDAMITALIIAARQYCEQFQNRAYIEQVVTLKTDRFPLRFRIPRSPLISVTSINYIDTAGDDQLLSTDVYAVDVTSEPGKVTLKHNQTWPATQRIHHAVTVVYKAGYGNAAADVPQTVKQAMFLLLAHWYEHRYAACDVQMHEVPLAVKSLLMIDRCFT